MQRYKLIELGFVKSNFTNNVKSMCFLCIFVGYLHFNFYYMENAYDFYSISFIVLLGITIASLIIIVILKIVKSILKTFRKKARREARRKMRILRNKEILKKNQNISAIL